jgi:ABC-type oligopeptide transport system ATPase subunit
VNVSGEPLLTIQDLVVRYPGRRRAGAGPAVDGVTLQIAPGETLGLVGESGSGKTTIGRAILGLAPITAGTITFDGQDITRLSSRSRRALSSSIQIVYQDPYGSMNPTHTVGQILGEPLRNGIAKFAGNQGLRVGEMLERVGLPATAADRFPSQFSGGQRQRIAIARALMLSPRLVICDEPVSALDLSVQAQVLNLFRSLQEDLGVAYLFIAHDLDVVRHLSDRIMVLYRGQVMETGPAARVHGAPRHPYAQALHLAAPVPDPSIQAQRRAARAARAAAVPEVSMEPTTASSAEFSVGEAGVGELGVGEPGPGELGVRNGCVFASRCPVAVGICTTTRPELVAPAGEPTTAATLVACHLRDDAAIRNQWDQRTANNS